MNQRRSILVRSAVYQEGPKNPLKGISLKPLVSALNAQFGVGAGGKRGENYNLPCLRSQGALQWHGDHDPAYAETCSCAGQFRGPVTGLYRIPYESGLNLYCGALGGKEPVNTGSGSSRAKAWSRQAPSAVCSVACLEWANADRGTTLACYGHNDPVSALEIFPAKEAKRRSDCCGKHLGCPETGYR